MKYRDGMDAAENEAIGYECATFNDEPSLTQESFAKDADINILVRRYGIGGLGGGPVDPSRFRDFTGAPDLREALEIVRDAQEAFMSLDPRVRLRFENDPVRLWEFVQDENNIEEGIYLGIFKKPVPVADQAVSGEAGEAPEAPDGHSASS